jgi:Zn-dependent peptidase ImmA (M78 family)
MIFDDHRVPRRTREEIESEADRCRSYAELDQDGRIDLDQLLSALRIKLAVKPDHAMGDNEAYSATSEGHIACRRSISSGLRFGDPHARYVIAHELGHFFLHRGGAPKARKIGGNIALSFINEDESAEIQAWKFARALFVSRADLQTGETDEAIGIRIGLATGPVSLRREEVEKAIKARQPKTIPPSVIAYLDKTRRAVNGATAASMEVRERAWALAVQVPGEDPAKIRSARGYRVEWGAYARYDSQVGWTVDNGEVRAFMDLRGR